MNTGDRLNLFGFQVDRPVKIARWVQVALLILACLINGLLIIFRSELFGKWALMVIVCLAGLYGVMIIGNLQKVLLAAMIIDIPLRWDIYVGERYTSSVFGMREGWIISMTTLAMVILFILYFIQALSKPHSQPRLILADNVPLLCYLGFTTLSTLVATDPFGSLFQVFFLAQMYFFYVYMTSIIQTKNDVLFILFISLAALAAEGVIALMQQFIGLSINMLGISTVMEDGRVSGTLGSPNVAAGYFSLLMAPAFSVFFMRVPWLPRIGSLIAFSLGGIALLLTLSRGGWMAFAISIGIFFLALWLRGRMPTVLMLLILILLAIGLALFGGFLFDKLFGMRSAAALSRIPLMQIALQMISDHPLLGVGANNYALNIRQSIPLTSLTSFLYVVHNKFLLVWAETGLGGILSFIAFLGISIYRGWKTWQRNDPVLSILALAFSVAIIGQIAHMMVEIFDARTQIQALWLVAAMQSAMERMTRGGAHGES